tara:strand:+ start:1033 stop:1296 length:264 start_codon:yes stop_codon:yes gene_type:complete
MLREKKEFKESDVWENLVGDKGGLSINYHKLDEGAQKIKLMDTLSGAQKSLYDDLVAVVGSPHFFIINKEGTEHLAEAQALVGALEE